MVGSATERLLKNNDIYTIKDLALAKQEVLENLLGSR
jgi:predicted RecB family nuclease